jgi:thioredoxin-related protein
MKKILFFALAIVTTLTFSTKINAQKTEINWMSFEEAVAAQKVKPKKIMMDAFTQWCGPCKMLDKNTFHNPDVVKYVNENYYAVKFDAEGNEKISFKGKNYTNPRWDPKKAGKRNASHQLAGYFRIRAYPTILFLDEEANFLTPVKGYKTPQQLEIYLKLFATNDYKNLKSKEDWTKYQNEFNFTFK